ncbi:MAG: hypothetical protein R2741_10500 [Methanolobus sp.]
MMINEYQGKVSVLPIFPDGTHTISFSVQDDYGSWSPVETETLTINAAENQVPVAK